MNTCSCGNLLDDKSTQCPRCEALQVLGLEMDAGESDIRSARRLLVKIWQPDRFPDDEKMREAAETKLNDVNSAFEFLTATSTERGTQQRPAYASTYEAAQPTPPSLGPTSTEAAATLASAPTVNPPEPLWPKIKPFLVLAAVALFLLAGRLIWVGLRVHHHTSPAVAGVNVAGSPNLPQAAEAPKKSFIDSVVRGLKNLALQTSAPADDTQVAPPVPVNVEKTQPKKTQTSAATDKAQPQPTVGKLLPYLTVGSTKEEVLALQGTPTEASDDKLVYGKSELYLKDDVVTGWRIDPVSSPIRVKLWPQAPVNVDLDYFSYGSSRDFVLMVQGTPTAFSQNTFEYGGSIVYFSNNRVVSWKNDPSSIPLRARTP